MYESLFLTILITLVGMTHWQFMVEVHVGFQCVPLVVLFYSNVYRVQASSVSPPKLFPLFFSLLSSRLLFFFSLYMIYNVF